MFSCPPRWDCVPVGFGSRLPIRLHGDGGVPRGTRRHRGDKRHRTRQPAGGRPDRIRPCRSDTDAAHGTGEERWQSRFTAKRIVEDARDTAAVK